MTVSLGSNVAAVGVSREAGRLRLGGGTNLTGFDKYVCEDVSIARVSEFWTYRNDQPWAYR
jgi:hypothetical protein